MGVLRILLAIIVLLSHSQKTDTFIGGGGAVRSFFMISGFYMALVLNEKYQEPSTYKLFISNRLLRIYPTYWAVLFITMALSVGLYLAGSTNPFKLKEYLETANYMHPTTLAYLTFVNISIIGQESIFWLGMSKPDGLMFYTKNFYQTSPGLYFYMPVGQAWSVSLELMFYSIAPFFLRKSWWVLAGLAMLSLAVRLLLVWRGYDQDPWTYRFLPVMLVFFLAGGLGYRAYTALRCYPVPKWLQYVAFFSILAFTFLYRRLPTEGPKAFAYYVCFAVAIPFVFMLTKSWKWDRKIGELSYPIYIVHGFTLFFTWKIINRLELEPVWAGAVLLGLTIPLSMLLVRYVEEPVERFRQRRVASAKRVAKIS